MSNILLVSWYCKLIIFLDEVIVKNDVSLTKNDVGYIKRDKSNFISRKEQTVEQISTRNENIQ